MEIISQILFILLCSLALPCPVLSKIYNIQLKETASIANVSKDPALRYTTAAVNTPKLLQTTENVYEATEIISPMSVKDQKIIPKTLSHSAPSSGNNRRNVAPNFLKPAQTEAFGGGISLETLPSITVIAPDKLNSRENIKPTFTQQAFISKKASYSTSMYTKTTQSNTGSNQNYSIAKTSITEGWSTTKSQTYKKDTGFIDGKDMKPEIFTKEKPTNQKDKIIIVDTVKNPEIYTKPKPTKMSPTYQKEKDVIVDKGKTDPEIYTKPKERPTKISPTMYTKSPTKPNSKSRLEPPECNGEKSCKDRCGHKRQFSNVTHNIHGYRQSCFCDPECDTIFKDCCGDFDQQCNATFMLQDVVESEFDERWDCMKLHGDDSPIWIIGQCRPGWKDIDILQRCTKRNANFISEVIPVIDQYNNIFLNRYCAICNNVTEFSQWEFQVFCDVMPPTGYTEVQWATFLDYFCPRDSFNLTQTWGQRYCFDVFSDCWNSHADWETVEACQTGFVGVITEMAFGVHYRNWDCVLCNFDSVDGIVPITLCGPSSLKTGAFVTPGGTPPYSSIFRASSLPNPQSQCPHDQVYDETFQECRIIVNNLDFGDILKRYAVTLEYEEQSDSCGASLFTGEESTSFIKRLTDVFEKLLEIALMERNSKLVELNILARGNSGYRVIFELLESSEENELVDSNIGQELKLQNLAFHSLLHSFGKGLCRYSMDTGLVRKMLCAENETLPLNGVAIYENKSALIAKTGQSYNFQEYLVFKDEKRLALCKDYWPGNCTFYIEVKNESDWSIFENGSVHTDVMKTSWLHYGEYTIVGGVLRVCSSYSKALFSSISTASVHDVILSHATTVGLSMSITSLAVLLMVYSYFPALRNLPGRNLMLFSVTLALVQLLWLLQPYTSLSSTLCVVSAFVMQYFFLASFSSSTSIAVHSLLTFHNIAKGKLTQSSSGNKFLYYALYSLGFPLVLSLASWLLYHYNMLSTLHIYQSVCWFKQGVSIYIAFYIPALSMFLLNLILISKTMLLLRACTNERRHLAKENGSPTKAQIGIYLRVSTIIGATWIFGIFIVVLPDILIFHYLYVFTNSLQGLYIAIAFLFTENVKKIILKRKDRGTTTRNIDTSRTMY